MKKYKKNKILNQLRSLKESEKNNYSAQQILMDINNKKPFLHLI